MPTHDAMATVAVMTLTAGVTVLPQFLPKLWDVHHASPDSSEADDIRVGEVVVVAYLSCLGLVAASIAGNPDPFVASLILAVFLVGTYETALRNHFGVVTHD